MDSWRTFVIWVKHFSQQFESKSKAQIITYIIKKNALFITFRLRLKLLPLL